VGVVAASFHSLAIRSDGTIATWGGNTYLQGNVPPLPAGLSYVEAAASPYHVVARRSDGSAIAWGLNQYAQCAVPPLPAGVTYVEVAAGAVHSLARRSDGMVVAFGGNLNGQCNVPPLPSGLTCVEIAAGSYHSVARLSDGSLQAWGANHLGQCNIPAIPPGLTYTAIAAGGFVNHQGSHTIALRSDGAVLAWGDNTQGQCAVPATPAGMACIEIDAGGFFSCARYGFAASSTAIGAGCGGMGGPVLVIGPPQISQPVFLGLSGGTPGASGFLVGSSVPSAPLSLGSGCAAQVDPMSAIPVLPVVTGSAGTWTTGLLVPPSPGLAGLQVVLQVVLFATAGPLGFDLSNGVVVVIGF
jgi:hypothetical protein